MQKMLFIFNPNTGGGRLRSRLMKLLCYFSANDFEVTVFPTAGPGDAQQAAREKASEYDIVVCCGGDGTLNEVVWGLNSCDKPPLLGYIPGGTTNDFASSLSLPKTDMMAAAKRIVQPKKIFEFDIGQFNQRVFTYVAAFGAFTDVSYSTPQTFKNIFGYFAYIVEAIPKLPVLQPCHMVVRAGDDIYEDDFVFGMISNSTSVGGFSFLAQDKVRMDDGVFEVLLVRHPHNISELRTVSAALLSRDIHSPWLLSLQANQVEFHSAQPLPWTLDGEYGGEPQTVHVEVLQRALRICT